MDWPYNKMWKKRLQSKIKNDIRVAEDTINDNNKISTLLLIKFMIMIVHFSIVILNICYFLGLAWFIMCNKTL